MRLRGCRLRRGVGDGEFTVVHVTVESTTKFWVGLKVFFACHKRVEVNDCAANDVDEEMCCALQQRGVRVCCEDSTVTFGQARRSDSDDGIVFGGEVVEERSW